MWLKFKKFKLLTLSCGLMLFFCAVSNNCTTLIEKVDDYIGRTKQSIDNLNSSQTAFIQPSLFPNVPPYIKFAPYYQWPSIEIPAPIRDGLLWRRSTILHSGGYVVHYIMNKTGIPAYKLSKIAEFGPNISWFGYWHEFYSTTIVGPLHVTQTYQKYNFFQQATELEKKDRQHWNFMRLIEKHGREEFPFYLDTFVLPEQLEEFKSAWNHTADKLWVVKPPNGYCSKGVKVISHWSEVPDNTFTTVQKYLNNPYLFSGRKIEIRNFVLTTSFNPLRVYILNDGDTKIGYKKYSSDPKEKDDLCIHTRPKNGHTACVEPDDVDDRHENFAKDFNFWENSRVYERLAADGVNVHKLQIEMHDYILKTIFSAEKVIGQASTEKHFNNYNAFQIWAIDFIIDEDLKPWILEINTSPDQTVNGDSDIRVQFSLVQETLNLAGYHFPPFLNKEAKDILQKYIQPSVISDPTFASIEKLYTFYLTEEDLLKRSQFPGNVTSSNGNILKTLTPGDVRQLIILEDELSRTKNFKRIFPTYEMNKYLKFIESDLYYYKLFDAWERKYYMNRSAGIARLSQLAAKGIHLR